ncbi:glycoside hydrolase family 2 TIM barrel-domain containing protein [Streptomyces sp. NPDC048577]|uniref:glycoside hydrolase family 2 protein n=1 Tax=Streptomyces sp. NPDC048577 TaxID=3157209 RepID=UPI0034211971
MTPSSGLPRRSLLTASLGLAVAAGAWGTASTSAQAATSASSVTRPQVDLNAGWRFLRSDAAGAQHPGFDDSSWMPVSVPHTWNNLDAQDGGSSKSTNSDGYYRGTSWYRRHYTPPASYSGSMLWLQFDAVSLVADVYVNGVHLGQHRGGFGRFRFDASKALVLGQDNVIAVKVSNEAFPDVPPLSADFPVGGGIYRGVSLVVTDPLMIRMTDFGGPGVYVRQQSLSASSATVAVTTKTWNNYRSSRSVAVRTVITDAAGEVVATGTSSFASVEGGKGRVVEQQLTISAPHLWDGTDDPYLYTVTAEVLDTSVGFLDLGGASGTVRDAVAVTLGLRSIAVDPDTGFSLNGRNLPLHGVNAHQDRLNQGWAVSDAQHVQDFDLMDEMGVNALRTAHYQQAPTVYDLADQRGYIVWAEVPVVDLVTDSAAFTANAEQQMRELIRQNHHHPSIAFWSIGNEQRYDNTATNTLLAALANVVEAEDPDRISTYACNSFNNNAGFVKHTDTTAYNKYFDWYYEVQGAYTFAGWADSLHKAQPNRKLAISEYGAGASIHHHEENPMFSKTRPGSNFHSEEYQAKVHEENWAVIAPRTYLWGSFVWNMFDFASDWRDEGDTRGRNDKGLVTYDRTVRKDAFYFYKANWNTTASTTHITSRRWTDRTDANTTVKVYSTGASVRLTLNGRDLGAMKAAEYHVFTLGVTLDPGTNTLQATGSNGVTDTVTWTLT